MGAALVAQRFHRRSSSFQFVHQYQDTAAKSVPAGQTCEEIIGISVQ